MRFPRSTLMIRVGRCLQFCNSIYDNLNRLTSISYNTSGATGVAATNNVAYTYDTSQTSATNGLLLSITMTGPMATYTETFSYDDFKRVSSRTWTRDSLSYTTSYQYNTANQITQMIYPVSGRTLNLAYDSAGRVSSIADQYRTYANNFTFNPAGQVTGLSLGNVATETYGYDTNRMQLTSQTASQNGGSTNGLMNLHYYYEAAAGQMGAGSTAGNAGQLMAINNNSTINGTTESAAYTYDDLGRLVTSNQTSNGSSAQRRFGYDRWGNRTGMWDATSGGTQIQSIALQQSGGAPTNQITSVTASGATKNYSYDANGNLINDGAHVYTYDAENRLRTVDWGTSNQTSYVYDYANRRIKKYTNAMITYYVWEGNQVIGEYDSTGGTVYNYVYSGGRLIARTGSGLINWYLRDRLSQRLVLDANGNVIGRMAHLPFGEDFAESGTQEKHHFTSYESDSESGADYAVNRQYSQSIGRFMRVDPMAGSLGNPQSLDRYSYVKNDPIRLTDPLGLDDFLPGSGSGVPWDWIWLYGMASLFQNVGNSAPDEVPAIPVASIPSDVLGGGQALECRQRIALLMVAFATAEGFADGILRDVIQFGDQDKFGERSGVFAAFL